jgi:hypothetical protein
MSGTATTPRRAALALQPTGVPLRLATRFLGGSGNGPLQVRTWNYTGGSQEHYAALRAAKCRRRGWIHACLSTLLPFAWPHGELHRLETGCGRRRDSGTRGRRTNAAIGMPAGTQIEKHRALRALAPQHLSPPPRLSQTKQILGTPNTMLVAAACGQLRAACMHTLCYAVPPSADCL